MSGTPIPDAVAPVATKSPGHSMAYWLTKLGPAIGLIFVFILFSALKPNTFPTQNNVVLMLRETTVVAVAAIGMTIIIVAGGIDLSAGSQIALSCVAVGKLLQQGASPVVAFLGGVAVSVLTGGFIGTLVTGLRLAPFIVTLGMMTAVRGAAIGWSEGVSVYPPDMNTWLSKILNVVGKGDAWMILPPGVWMLILLAALVAAALRYTRFGRHVFAVGSNEQTAVLCGIPVARTKIIVYSLGGLFAGLAGVLQFSYLNAGDPVTATGMELSIIAAVVIGGASLNGGQGTILGTIIGALIMKVIDNGCIQLGWPNWVQQIVTGGIIIVAVALDRFRRTTA